MEYCCNVFRAPAFSRAVRVAAGKCFTNVPWLLRENISISACRAVCGADVAEDCARAIGELIIASTSSVANFLIMPSFATPRSCHQRAIHSSYGGKERKKEAVVLLELLAACPRLQRKPV